MSSNRFGPKFVPLRYEPPPALAEPQLGQLDQAQSELRLASIRSGLLADAARAGLHVDLLNRPDSLLAEYQAARRKSRLGRILSAATRLREAVDRVVVIDGGGFELGRSGDFRSLLPSVPQRTFARRSWRPAAHLFRGGQL